MVENLGQAVIEVRLPSSDRALVLGEVLDGFLLDIRHSSMSRALSVRYANRVLLV